MFLETFQQKLKTLAFRLRSYRYKGNLGFKKLLTSCYLIYMGEWVQYSGPSHALNYTGLIHLKKRGHEKIWGGKFTQTPSTWEWPLLFLINHNTTLTPLEDTSCGTGRVKLLQSLLVGFFWSRNISKQAKETKSNLILVEIQRQYNWKLHGIPYRL